MAGDAYQELPRAKRRSLVARAVLRSLLSATVLVVLYYVLPLDRPLTADTAAASAGSACWSSRASWCGRSEKSLARATRVCRQSRRWV